MLHAEAAFPGGLFRPEFPGVKRGRQHLNLSRAQKSLEWPSAQDGGGAVRSEAAPGTVIWSESGTPGPAQREPRPLPADGIPVKQPRPQPIEDSV